MIKAVLFDMDGLIFDTEGLYKTSWQYAAAEQGLDLSDNFYQNFIGVQDPDCERMLVSHFGEKFNLERYRKVRDEHFHAARAKGVAFKKGFHSLFEAITEQKLLKALVTSSHLPEVEFNFAGSDYLSCFDVIVTAEDVENGKPNPDCYLLACSKLDIEPQTALVLEDSNNGVKAGLDAGNMVAMIPDLLPPGEEILKSRAMVLETLDDVISKLN